MNIEKEIIKANSGSAIRQHSLGMMYKNGKEVPQDYCKAFHWLKKAAEQELPQAIYQLGLMYEEGKGVQQNDMEAVKCYNKAKELLESRKNIERRGGIYIQIVCSIPINLVSFVLIGMSFDAPGSDKMWSGQLVLKILYSGLYFIIPFIFALAAIILNSAKMNKEALLFAKLTFFWPIFLFVFRLLG